MKQILKRVLPGPVIRFIQANRPLSQGTGVLPFQYYPTQRKAAEYAVLPRSSANGPDGLPVPPQSLWYNYNKTVDRYLEGGKNATARMLGLISDSGRTLPKAPILDFGCGSARMLRHLKTFTEDREVWGVDVSAPHIQWCISHLQPPFRFATTTILPHLPFPDGFFGLIYAGSVFTHIEDLASAWLCELRRVLTPGGLLYVTIHDESSIEWLRNNDTKLSPRVNRVMKRHKTFDVVVIGRRVSSQVFYRRDYFVSTLVAPLFDVLSETDMAYGFQTAILVQQSLTRPAQISFRSQEHTLAKSTENPSLPAGRPDRRQSA